ncbi:hypothetical protein D3C72_2219450 [compost metagenome]
MANSKLGKTGIVKGSGPSRTKAGPSVARKVQWPSSDPSGHAILMAGWMKARYWDFRMGRFGNGFKEGRLPPVMMGVKAPALNVKPMAIR